MTSECVLFLPPCSSRLDENLSACKLLSAHEQVQERLNDVKAKTAVFERKQAELRETVQKNKQFIRDTDAKIDTAEKKVLLLINSS